MKYNKLQQAEIERYLDRHNCTRCTSSQELTIDHIVPVHFLMEQLKMTRDETFDWDNFQPLCRRCNALKSGRFDLADPRTKVILLKYINKYCE